MIKTNTYKEVSTPELVYLYKMPNDAKMSELGIPYYETSDKQVYLLNKITNSGFSFEKEEVFNSLPQNVVNILRYRAIESYLISKGLIEIEGRLFFSPDIFKNKQIEALFINNGFRIKKTILNNEIFVAVIPDRIITKDGKTFEHQFQKDNYAVLNSDVFAYLDFVDILNKVFNLLGGKFEISFDSGKFVYEGEYEPAESEIFSAGPEPKIALGANQEIHDFPAAGLKRFGPWDLNTSNCVVPNPISVGIIGQGFSKGVLNKLVKGESAGSYPFPGFNAVYKKKITSGGFIDLSNEELEKCQTATEFKKLILEKYKQFEKSPDVLVIEMPEFLITKFENINLRSYIKVIFWEQRQPTQIITECTEDVKEGLFWDNLALGIYTSAGGKPWILEEPIENSVFIGMSFGLTPSGKVIGLVEIIDGYGLSLDMQVSELGNIPSGERVDEDRDLHFNSGSMTNFLKQAIKRYSDKYGGNPNNVVIHKTTLFNEDEKKILEDKDLASSTILDLVCISAKGNGIYLLDGNNIPNRLIGWKYEDSKVVLYTKGKDEKGRVTDHFIPRPMLVSFEGSTNPGRNTIEKISKDIIKLTKLNWNSVNSYEREPVTISHSRRIKELLKLDLDLTEVPQDIRYFL